MQSTQHALKGDTNVTNRDSVALIIGVLAPSYLIASPANGRHLKPGSALAQPSRISAENSLSIKLEV